MREGREHHAMDLRELALDGARTVKASLSAVPGIQITKSILVVASTSSASAIVDTCVNVGG